MNLRERADFGGGLFEAMQEEPNKVEPKGTK
jgi:hypothetical protein